MSLMLEIITRGNIPTKIIATNETIFLSATLTDLWLGKPLKSQVFNIGAFSVCFILRQGIDLIDAKLLDDYAIL